MRNNKEKIPSDIMLLQKVIEPCIKVRYKLDEQYLTVADVLRWLKITRRQLFYWDRKGLKFSEKQTSKRSWRKFSILDLFVFSIVKELLKFGLTVEPCKGIIEIFRYRFYDYPLFLYPFATGGVINLGIDVVRRDLGFIHIGTLGHALDIENPHIIIPIHVMLRRILENVKKEDFYVKFSRVEDFKNLYEAVFYVDGKPIWFDLTQEEKSRVDWPILFKRIGDGQSK